MGPIVSSLTTVPNALNNDTLPFSFTTQFPFHFSLHFYHLQKQSNQLKKQKSKQQDFQAMKINKILIN